MIWGGGGGGSGGYSLSANAQINSLRNPFEIWSSAIRRPWTLVRRVSDKPVSLTSFIAPSIFVVTAILFSIASSQSFCRAIMNPETLPEIKIETIFQESVIMEAF